jgi:hypothetical protein
LKISLIRKLALALPGTEERPHFDLWSFRVGGKIFATVPPEEDELRVFVAEDLREEWVAADPRTFARLSWGAKVVGLRIALATAEPEAVEKLLRAAWQCRAPRGPATRRKDR